MHLGLDLGLYDPSASGARTALFVAGNLGYDLARASSEQPLDLLLTAGAGLSLANGRTSLRLPVGVSLGHRFELDQGFAITPFVHPRVSIDVCSSCSSRNRSQSDVSLNFDVGGELRVQLAAGGARGGAVQRGGPVRQRRCAGGGDHVDAGGAQALT